MPGELRIQLRQISPSASEAVIGEHRVTIDRPSTKGGSGLGPMGGELFLAALGGCFMSNLFAAIRARESEVRNVHVEVKGSIGRGDLFATAVLSLTCLSWIGST